MTSTIVISFFFFFNDTATTEIYTLSLHDALPISNRRRLRRRHRRRLVQHERNAYVDSRREDRKSTRLNSSHSQISYAVFCLKKKKKKKTSIRSRNDTCLIHLPTADHTPASHSRRS